MGNEHDPELENVDTLTSLRARAKHGVSRHQRRIEQLTAQLGQPWAFYLILAFAAAWSAFNWTAPRLGVRAFDPPPFVWLQGLVGLSALLMTSIILITQNRRAIHAEQAAELDLQVALRAEHKAAKVIALLEELRRDSPTVRDRVDRVADAMTEPIDAHAVLSALEGTTDSISSKV